MPQLLLEPVIKAGNLVGIGTAPEKNDKFITIIAVQPCIFRKNRLDDLRRLGQHLISKLVIVQLVDAGKTIQIQDHHEEMLLLGNYHLQRILQLIFVKLTAQIIDFILTSQIGDNAGKQNRLTILIPLHMTAASEPHPLASAVSGTILHIVKIHTVIGNFLIPFQKYLLVCLMNSCAPYIGSIMHDFRWEIKFLNHGTGISEAGRVLLHIAYIDIIIAALHQGTQQQILIIGKLAHLLTFMVRAQRKGFS